MRSYARPSNRVVVSAAVVPDAQTAFDSRMQDWRGWAEQSLIDVLCPMAYTTDADTFHMRNAPRQSMRCSWNSFRDGPERQANRGGRG